MTDEQDPRAKLATAIEALEAQRPLLGDAVDPAIESLREQLAAQDATAEEVEDQRKQVTILFADVKGFTHMSQTMDPEDVAATMNQLWSKVDRVVIDHGGRVDKHIGDAVMAIFGAPIAKENDPERAVNAALEMQQVIKEHSGLEMRIGINTGLAMLGLVGSTDEYTAIGHTVNLASRLEGKAPPGGTLISHDTFAHVRGVFDVAEVERLDVKGVDEPVRAYEVKRAKPRTFRVATREVAGIETKTVGRDKELAQLVALLPETPDGTTDVAITTIVGEPGVGKSRILYEYFNHLEAQPHPVWLFRGRAIEATREQAHTVMRSIISDRFQIQAADAADDARAKLETGLADYMGPDGAAAAPFIGHLVGLDYLHDPAIAGLLTEPRVIRNKAFAAFADLLHRGRDGRYVVVLVEDLHWADAESLDFLEYLAEQCDDLPMVVLCTARPDMFDTRPEWGEGPHEHLRIDLHPLGPEATTALVVEVLRHLREIPEELTTLITERSEGNPFFLEELVKMLIDDGVIETGDDGWTVHTEMLTEARLPGTLTGVLQARLDALARPQRHVLRRASVVGRVFWGGAVDQLGDSMADNEEVTMDSVAPSLHVKELAYERPRSAFASTREFIFKHAILHDVVYETVVKQQRLGYHAAAATWLIDAAGDRVDEFSAQIAEHYRRAQDAAHAVAWLVRSGDQARTRHALDVATRAYERALEAAAGLDGDVEGPHRLAALDGLGDVLTQHGEYEEAIARYEEMRDLAAARGEQRLVARAGNGLATAQAYRGDHRGSVETTRWAAGVAREADLPHEEARALALQGWSMVRLGALDEARALSEQAVEISDGIGDEALLANALNLAGIIDASAGDFAAARNHFERAAESYTRLGNEYALMPILNNIGVIEDLLGEYEAAGRHFADALKVADRTNNRDEQMVYTSNLGGTEAALGRYEEAESHLRWVIETERAGLAVMPETLRYLAEALSGQGRYDEAITTARSALEAAEASEAPDYVCAAWRTLGVVQSLAGSDDPVACFVESLRVAEAIGSNSDRARTLAAWAIHSTSVGDADATEHFDQAIEIFESLGATAEIARVRSQIA